LNVDSKLKRGCPAVTKNTSRLVLTFQHRMTKHGMLAEGVSIHSNVTRPFLFVTASERF
jgi:hypothetical protein